MVEYQIEVWAKPGPYVGGPIGTSEGDGVEAIKQAISKAGAVAKLVENIPSPRIFPPPFFFRAETEGPLEEENFRTTLEEVWNASVTTEGQEPFPGVDRIHVSEY